MTNEQSEDLSKAETIDWLMEDGRRAESIAALMEAFCRRLIAGGVPLFRANWHIRMLHPQIRGITFYWRTNMDGVEEIEREHGTELRPEYLNSPIGAIVEAGADAMRYRIEQLEPPYAYQILQDLKEQGGTDYVAMPMRFSTGRVNVASWSSDRAGGFTGPQLTLIYDVMPALSTVLETMVLRRLAVNVLDTYVGRDAGARILSGDIRRGTGATLRAVLWYCDLRGFTSLADRLPLADLIGLLNGYFEIMGGAVQAREGEILKFIGDAMLAIFPLPDGEEGDAGDGDPEAHGREVEHPERLAGHLAPHPRHDDVGRRADQRRQSAEQRPEGQRHQQPGRGLAGPARDLEGDRHEDGERADVLHEGRQHRHDADQDADLGTGGLHVRGERPHHQLDDAGAADGGAHHQC